MRFLITLLVIFSFASLVKPNPVRPISISEYDRPCGKSTPSDLERPDHRCGVGTGYAPCDPGRCCSYAGWCGNGDAYCSGTNCKYQCWNSLSQPNDLLPKYGSNPISKLISKSIFDEMFKHRKDCPSQGFYSYDAFITAAASFPSFAAQGDITTRKRELAAFFGQTSQATTGQWFDSQDPHAWGYCYINKTTNWNEKVYCTSHYWSCAPGKKYYSRGPAQLTHNYNYGRAGEALGLDLISSPELVATDPVVSFKTAIWFWMTRHGTKPSCHDILIHANFDLVSHVPSYAVIVGDKDRAIIVPRKSYDVIGDIFNRRSGRRNGLVANTITTSVGYYKRYCDLLQVSYGNSLKYWYS